MSVTSLQRNGKAYLVGDLKVMEAPTDEELASWGVAEHLRKQAPNEKIVWLTGHYVSAGSGNRNGQAFTSDELAIKSITSRLMPVTVMHRPRDVVGVIADARLNLPTDEAAAAGAQASVDTVLAIWGHRFPEVADEIAENAAAGMLMQSMEADAPWYDCSECGERFVKPVNEDQHCEHLTNRSADRTLGDVTFTGTGLIFGSRGSEGADPNAYLAEVAEWADARQDSSDDHDKDEDSAMKVEIDKTEYDALVADKAALAALKRRVDTDLEPAAAKLPEAETKAAELETQLTEAEVQRDAAVTEAETANAKLAAIEEEQAKAELSSTRLSEIPKALAEKLPEATAKRLAEKASTMTDDEWQAEVAEKAELLSIKMDGEAAGDVFAEQAISGFNANGNVTKASGNAPVFGTLAAATAHMLRDKRNGK